MTSVGFFACDGASGRPWIYEWLADDFDRYEIDITRQMVSMSPCMSLRSAEAGFQDVLSKGGVYQLNSLVCILRLVFYRVGSLFRGLFRFEWLKPFLISVSLPWLGLYLYTSYDFSLERRNEILSRKYVDRNRCQFPPTKPGGYIFELSLEPRLCRYFSQRMDFVLEVSLDYPAMVPTSNVKNSTNIIQVSLYPYRSEQKLRSIEPIERDEILMGGAQFLNIRGERVERFSGFDGFMVSINHRYDRRVVYRVYRGLQVVYEFDAALTRPQDIDPRIVSFLDRAIKQQ